MLLLVSVGDILAWSQSHPSHFATGADSGPPKINNSERPAIEQTTRRKSWWKAKRRRINGAHDVGYMLQKAGMIALRQRHLSSRAAGAAIAALTAALPGSSLFDGPDLEDCTDTLDDALNSIKRSPFEVQLTGNDHGTKPKTVSGAGHMSLYEPEFAGETAGIILDWLSKVHPAG